MLGTYRSIDGCRRGGHRESPNSGSWGWGPYHLVGQIYMRCQECQNPRIIERIEDLLENSMLNVMLDNSMISVELSSGERREL